MSPCQSTLVKTAAYISLGAPLILFTIYANKVLLLPIYVQGGFFNWSALKNDLSVRLHVNPIKKVLSVRISYGSGT